MRLFPIIALAICCHGCCVGMVAEVRNQTGREISIRVMPPHEAPPTLITIPPGASRLCPGVIPGDTGTYGKPETAWLIADGQSQFYFADVSPVATMRGASRTESRFTRLFPCNRITQHVAIETNMAIYAVAGNGRKMTQPAGFPISGIATNVAKLPILEMQNPKTNGPWVVLAFTTTNHLDDLTRLQKHLEDEKIPCLPGASDLGAVPVLVRAGDFIRARTAAIKITRENSLTIRLEVDAQSNGYEVWQDGKKTGDQHF